MRRRVPQLKAMRITRIEKAHIFTCVKTGADERSFVSLASLLWRLHKPVGFVAV
jgi:hypothetical protein